MHPRLLVLIIVSAAVAVVGPARAIDGQGRVSGKANANAIDCGNVATQSEMNNCFAREAKRIQDLLNALVEELRKHVGPEESQELQRVQATWTAYRDAHCQWQAHFFEGGSIQPTEYSTCIAESSWSRIGELKFSLCEGHGMTGPCAASRRYDRPTPTRGK
jgi:uncharacterized protein YecT (DUF1311 family)